MGTTIIEKPAKTEESTTQKEIRGLLEAAISAVKEKNGKKLMTFLGLAMAKVDEL